MHTLLLSLPHRHGSRPFADRRQRCKAICWRVGFREGRNSVWGASVVCLSDFHQPGPAPGCAGPGSNHPHASSRLAPLLLPLLCLFRVERPFKGEIARNPSEYKFSAVKPSSAVRSLIGRTGILPLGSWRPGGAGCMLASLARTLHPQAGRDRGPVGGRRRCSRRDGHLPGPL